jgi:hypothetical protein
LRQDNGPDGRGKRKGGKSDEEENPTEGLKLNSFDHRKYTQKGNREGDYNPYMQRQIFHGGITPTDIAQALLGEFNRGNLRAQALGESDKILVQIGTRPGAAAGGETALAVHIQSVEDGIMVELGEQAWLGVAASFGVTALTALRNPLALLNRLDDLAQDIENMQISDRIWQVIHQTSQAAGASRTLSERLSRLECDYCGSANPLGEPSCIACGAPLGRVHPTSCSKCGFALKHSETICPNCGSPV